MSSIAIILLKFNLMTLSFRSFTYPYTEIEIDFVYDLIGI
jgi:hypothetical protein